MHTIDFKKIVNHKSKSVDYLKDSSMVSSDLLYFDSIINEISQLKCSHNIKCFLLYGSAAKGKNIPNDTDIIVILEEINTDSKELFDWL